MTAIKDHGVREQMATGSQRDTQKGKPRPELIPASVLVKLACHYGKGAEKYDPWNWAKGQPVSRYSASLKRHLMAWDCGQTDENHLIAVIWNAISLIYTLDAIEAKMLPKELDDRHECQRENNPLGNMLYAEIEAEIQKKVKE
jgi:hypothetical protein